MKIVFCVTAKRVFEREHANFRYRNDFHSLECKLLNGCARAHPVDIAQVVGSKFAPTPRG